MEVQAVRAEGAGRAGGPRDRHRERQGPCPERHRRGRVLLRVPGPGRAARVQAVRAEAHNLQRRGVAGGRDEGDRGDEIAGGAPERGRASGSHCAGHGADQGSPAADGFLREVAGSCAGEQGSCAF